MTQLPPQYDPKQVEDKIYAFWQKGDYFNPDSKIKNLKFKIKNYYSIVIPPPNVTGSLHMGHALNNTLQDILIRRARMQGKQTLWIPGTDHAGIATQNVVEKKLRKEGKSRHNLGREKFVEQVWDWKQEYGNKIIDQLKKLGCSCDWSRERFTMDDDYSKAIEHAFMHHYNKGWIYQGTRVINWCTRCWTSISDLEVDHVEEKAKLYYFKYNKNFPITIATTRPETKLGDTAVAVHPSDKRYKKFIGKSFDVEFAGVKRKIKIIADKDIDPKFGSGALGVTPAHSLIDAEIAEKNNLPIIQVIDQKGQMTTEAGTDFVGLKVLDAREKVVTWLEKEKLLEKVEDITHNLTICDRCKRPIEPQPSEQWFLSMKELAKPAIEAIKKDEVKFYPIRWKKVTLDWLENIHDWCISRQLWWGHRLPVWQCQTEANTKSQSPNHKQISNLPAGRQGSKTENYKINSLNENCKLKIENYVVSVEKPKQCPFCKKCQMIQSEDVLDTWFSSALWPFATLGWPNKTKDLEKFFPTTTLSTARDIIYLWVARMIFSSLEFMGEVPFKQVYIHPTVFNKDGKRMSKSLGTGVDPLELIEKYGTDATRFGLAFQDTGTQDMKFSDEHILAAKKFANKMWNASRFVIQNTQNNTEPQTNTEQPKSETSEDKIILSKLYSVIKSTDENLDKFRFGQAAHDLYDFFWHDFCDKYLEESKLQLEDIETKQNTEQILLFTLTQSLKLLHPFMPFVTEEIYQNLLRVIPSNLESKSIMVSQWPSSK